MRRILVALLVAASTAFPLLPVRAAGAPVPADTTSAKTRIDGFVKYMTDQAEFAHIEATGVIPTIDLRTGLFPYVEDWVGIFQRARMAGTDGGFGLSEKAPVGVSSADSTYGETINGFYTYCSKYKDLLARAQGISDKAMGIANADLVTEDMQKQVSEVMRTLAAAMNNAMALSINPDPKSTGLGVCTKAVADMYYAFRHPGGTNTSFACVANIVLNPLRDPANDSGTCVRRNDRHMDLGKMPGCVAGSCSAEIDLCNDSGCTYYSFKPVRASLDSSLDLYTKTLDEAEKKLSEVGGALAQAGVDAGKLKADLQARGTALSLPLPLSDITVPQLIGRILNALLGIVGAIALLLFVWGGFSWMTAAGNQDQIGKAKKTITWAALGLIAIFGAYAVLKLVIDTFR